MSEVPFEQMSPEEVAKLSIPASAVMAVDGEGRQRLRDMLAEHGVVIVTDVLDERERIRLEQCWRADLTSLVDREAAVRSPNGRRALRDLNTVRSGGPSEFKGWARECNAHLGPQGRGFATSRGMPHGEFAWQCRLHPTVRRTFAAIFQVEPSELATGLDNLFWSGPESEAKSTNSEWLHVDQNHNTGLTFPYVWSSEARRASTAVVWPKSHRPEVYDEIIVPDPYAVQHGRNPWGQLIKLNLLESEAGKELYARALKGARRVPVPAGALLLWDSRLTHQGWSGGPRLAQPVCWEPHDRRPKDALLRKLWMCSTGSPSTHSSSEGRVHPLAPKGPAAPFPGSEDGDGTYALPLRPSIVPYGIRPGAEQEWHDMQSKLWARDREASYVANEHAIRSILRPEVADAL